MTQPRQIRIEEDDLTSPSTSTIQQYSSHMLPEWFQPLRPFLEDGAFSAMTIQLQQVRYLLSLVEEVEAGHLQSCQTCGRRLAFPQLLFYHGGTYCPAHVPVYDKAV
jgi:hypothetical protein